MQKITALATTLRITYELVNVNSICWYCLNIATDEREVDYWKSEIITLVVKFCF